MRILPLFALLLVACTGDPSDHQVPARQVPAPGGAVDQAGRAATSSQPAQDAAPLEPAEPGAPTAVTITLDVATPPTEGSLALLGARPEQRVGDWIEHDAEPAFWWPNRRAPIQAPLELSAPLAPGLLYFVVLSVDEDELAGPGDFVGGPVLYEVEGQPLTISVDRRFADRIATATAQDAADAAPAPATGLPVTLTTDVVLDFVASGRIVVAGRPPGSSGAPTFTWTSEPLTLDWPLRLNIPLPEGLDLVIALDLDGSGAPDGGDLATPVQAAWTAPGGDIAFRLTEVLADATP